MSINAQVILDALETAGKPIIEKELFSQLSLQSSDGQEFLELLDELELSGKIIRTKKGKFGLPIMMNLIIGTLSVTQKGFGFIVPYDRAVDDVFVPAAHLGGAMHGDVVYGKITGKGHASGRKEGEIVKVIKRANQYVVGTLDHNHSFGFVIPDNKRIGIDIYIPEKGLADAKDGQKVVVKIVKWPAGRRNPEGVINEVLGYIEDEGVDVLSVIRKFQLPEQFPKKVLREAERIGQEVMSKDLQDRRDLRAETVITIDGADAKDLDDAVQVKKMSNGNYYLAVHIADVTHYVKEDSKLDKEAIKRGTSVYLIDRVIPMLPPALSNGICSLNPSVDRLTMTCEMEIDSNGAVLKYDIFPSVIHSNARMTYRDVSDILEGVAGAKVDQYSELINMFKDMEALSVILKQKRQARGAIDFDFGEPYIELDDTGKPIEIKERERRIANRIIEEFMLAANETVAEHVYWLEYPFVYRIHEDPSAEKIASFNKFVHNFGYRLKGSEEDMHPKEVQRLLKAVAGTKEERLINKLMLRSLQQAKYSPICEGHFGLAAKYYSHFTSPIRRYPDLQIHRILKDIIANRMTAQRIAELKKTVDYISQQSSERERVAEQAERETDDMKKAEYMQQFVGETFEGMISSVTSFGIFTELDNTIEGLTPLSMLEDDYYQYDEARMRMVGERTKKIYTIGDRVRVKVNRVDVAHREIDFIIEEKISEN